LGKTEPKPNRGFSGFVFDFCQCHQKSPFNSDIIKSRLRRGSTLINHGKRNPRQRTAQEHSSFHLTAHGERSGSFDLQQVSRETVILGRRRQGGVAGVTGVNAVHTANGGSGLDLPAAVVINVWWC